MTTTIERHIRADGATALAHYPHVVRAGDLVFVSGTSSRVAGALPTRHEGVVVERDGDGNVVGVHKDAEVQSRAVLANIAGHLASVGLGLGDLVDVTVFLVDMADYAAMNRAWDAVFPDPQRAPARTTVAVAALPHPHLLVEMKAVAYGARRR